MRYLILLVAGAATLVTVSLQANAKSKPKNYEVGRLLDVGVQDVSRGTAIVGGIAAPIRGKLYLFQIQVGDLVYFAEYGAGALSYKPEWVVNDPIEVRLEKENKMFLKRPDGKELEVVVVKKVRSESATRN